MRITLLFFSTLLIIFSSCGKNGSQDDLSLDVEIKNAPAGLVMLEEVRLNDNQLVDSITIVEGKKFTLHAAKVGDVLYAIRIGELRIPVIGDSKMIKISGDYLNPNTIKVSGSAGTASIQRFEENFQTINVEINNYHDISDSLQTVSAHLADSFNTEMVKLKGGAVQKLYTYIKNFADTAKSFSATWYAMQYLHPTENIEYLNKLTKSFSTRFPDNANADSIVIRINDIAKKELKSGLQIGDEAPNFSLNNAAGQTVNLKSTRGKYVLLDFWASWCPPCRAENPNLVAAYKKYKVQNFEIVSVSLDQTKSKWTTAITEDKLSWLNLNDPAEWNSPLVELYGFESIPTNFLLDPSGKVIAKNLRGDALETALSKFVNPGNVINSGANIQ